MTLLITGAGLVGSQIARIAVEKGERPVIYDLAPQPEVINQIVSLEKIDIVRGDVLDLNALEDTIRTRCIKKVIHTAANPMLTVGAQEKPYDAIKLNVMGTVNVLEAARKLSLDKVVFTSSSVLYTYRKGGLESGKLSEDNYPRTTTIYASTKLACENLGLNYAENYGLDFVAVRFQAVFGPWGGKGGGGGPSNMFKQLIEKSMRGEEATISPRVIEFVYSKDAARSTILAAEKAGLRNRVYNVGMGRIYRPEELLTIIRQKIPSANIRVEEMHIGSPATKVDEPTDLTRSRTELGYEPQYDMPKAVEDYVDWYKQFK
ncbi:MAG: NAD(P)-dependent oxidoreductase [Thaumarchaeota archaeon]|nr:NAD(P)-dependent oxidoreductase [Nitrososphaerota archaeon]